MKHLKFRVLKGPKPFGVEIGEIFDAWDVGTEYLFVLGKTYQGKINLRAFKNGQIELVEK